MLRQVAANTTFFVVETRYKEQQFWWAELTATSTIES
jgi:hypothetical protein